MNEVSYEQVIVAGIRNLSSELQREVADFVYFLRQREQNDQDLQKLIEADLTELEASELKHLDEEFEDYEQLYPRQ